MKTTELPSRADLVAILEGLLDGRIRREQVDGWLAQLRKTCPWDYLGPPIPRDEGFWEFLTLADVTVERPDGSFALRNADLVELLAELRGEPGETQGLFKRHRVHEGPFFRTHPIGFGVMDPEHVIQSRIPLLLHRAVVDDLGDLREHLCFRLNGATFRVDRFEETPDELWIQYEPGTTLDSLSALVTHLEIETVDITSNDRRPTILERQDDNGNVVLVQRHPEVIAALCERATLERTGHRQVYTVRFVEA